MAATICGMYLKKKRKRKGKNEEKEEPCFSGLVIAISGALSKIRREWENIINQNGGRTTVNVSK